jgi:hypothetical protein
MAGRHDRLVECGTGKIEDQLDLAALAALARSGIEHALLSGRAIAAKNQTVTGLDALAGAHKGLPAVRARPHVQRCGNTDLIAPRLRNPSSCAGITLVSLNTSASPGCSFTARSLTMASESPPSGATHSILALSRGACGPQRDAFSGRSKSKRSTRISAPHKKRAEFTWLEAVESRAYQ